MFSGFMVNAWEVASIVAVVAGVVDERRDEELLLRPLREISGNGGGIIELGEACARMRTAGTDDDRKPELGVNVGASEFGAGDAG